MHPDQRASKASRWVCWLDGIICLDHALAMQPLRMKDQWHARQIWSCKQMSRERGDQNGNSQSLPAMLLTFLNLAFVTCRACIDIHH